MTWTDDALGREWAVMTTEIRPGVRRSLVVAGWVELDPPLKGFHRVTVADCMAPELAEHITRLHNESRQEARDATARSADLP